MKAKTLLLALVAGLFVFTACSKEEEDPSYSWTNEFQRSIKFIGTDYNTVIKQLQSDGYAYDSLTEVYYKADAKATEVYAYDFIETESKVTGVRFGVLCVNALAASYTAENYANFIKFLGAEYKVNDTNKFVFNHVTYNGTDGTQRISEYATFLQDALAISAYSSTAIWDGTVDSYKITIERNPETFSMYVQIANQEW